MYKLTLFISLKYKYFSTKPLSTRMYLFNLSTNLKIPSR